MPSSTSASELDREIADLPAPSARVWIAALLLTLVALGGMELFWRSRGMTPSVPDDEALWAYHRARVYEGGARSVALLGSSRMQVDFATRVFAARYPDTPLIQLAVSGRSPLATLEDLSRDPDFRGLVTMALEAAQVAIPESWAGQRPQVRFYHEEWESRDRWGLNGPRLDLLSSSVFAAHLVIRRPDLDLRRRLVGLIEGRGLPSAFNSVRFDRSRPSDYTRTNPRARRLKDVRLLRLKSADSVPEPEAWLRRADRLKRLVAPIRARGGDVVFVRFPTSRDRYKEEERLFPRARYWDRLAAYTGAETIHFRDLPGVRQLNPPDSSHLDFRDAPAFTQILLDEFERRGLLPR